MPARLGDPKDQLSVASISTKLFGGRHTKFAGPVWSQRVFDLTIIITAYRTITFLSMQISEKEDHFVESLHQVDDKTTVSSPALSVAEGLPFTFLERPGP